MILLWQYASELQYVKKHVHIHWNAYKPVVAANALGASGAVKQVPAASPFCGSPQYVSVRGKLTLASSRRKFNLFPFCRRTFGKVRGSAWKPLEGVQIRHILWE